MKCIHCGGEIRRASHISDAIWQHVNGLVYCDPLDPANKGVAFGERRACGDGDGDLETDGGGDSIRSFEG